MHRPMPLILCSGFVGGVGCIPQPYRCVSITVFGILVGLEWQCYRPLTSMMVICSFGAFQIKVTRSLKLTTVLTLSGLMGTAPSSFRAVICSGIMQLKLGIKGCLLYSSWYSTGIPRNWYWNSRETLLQQSLTIVIESLSSGVGTGSIMGLYSPKSRFSDLWMHRSFLILRTLEKSSVCPEG